MKKRNYGIFIKDILDAISSIDVFIANMTFEELSMDDKTLSAVIRKIEIIGEAAKNIPEEMKSKFPQIDWKGMAGMRDKLIHSYFGIDNSILWQVIKEDLPSVKPLIEEMLKNVGSK